MTEQQTTPEKSAGSDATPEIGRVYTVTIEKEIERPYIGENGLAYIGEYYLMFPKATVGQTFSVKVTSVGINPHSNRKEAQYELVK